MKSDIEKLVRKYPENFTGKTLTSTNNETAHRNRLLMTELEALASPLVKWLREQYGPHTEITITWDYVCVKHDGGSIPFPY